MKNILEIKRAERQEKERTLEERFQRETREYKIMLYNEISKKHHVFFNQVFIFGVSLGTIAILMMHYIGDKESNLNQGLALFPLIAFGVLVYAIIEMLNVVHNAGVLDVNKNIDIDTFNEEQRKKKEKAYKLFKFSIGFLLFSMLVIFCCKIHLISKILLLYDSYCQFIS